ncbi:MAG: hypothetical protein HY794_05960 [Desulfarculus sp.]|nr:hypothetical protein [Desulfarculus sp.]
MDYSHQKSYRLFNREIIINEKRFSLKHSDEIDLAQYPELWAAIEKFSSKRGRPITRWSKTSIEEKLKVIDQRGLIDIAILMISLNTFYDDCSEALHATIYGCIFHGGAYQPGFIPGNLDQAVKHHKEMLTTIFFLVGLLLREVNIYVSNKMDLKDINKMANDCGKQIEQTMKVSLKAK